MVKKRFKKAKHSAKIKRIDIRTRKQIKLKSDSDVDYIKTYVLGFDELVLSKGIPACSAVLVEGGPGSGKTIFCLQVAFNACQHGKKVLYMSFEESEERLIQHMREFGWEPEKYIKQGLLRIKRFDALDIARSVEALLSEAKKELLIDVQPMFFPQDFNPEIVCIDSVTSIMSAFTGEEARFRIYMEQLFRYLERSKITSFMIREVSNPSHVGQIYVEKSEAISFLSDGIIVLYNVIYENGRRGSAIEILKMRGCHIDRRIVEMEVKSKQGIVVYPKQELGDHHKIKYNLT